MTEADETSVTKTSSFIAGSWEELKKISYPTRQETIQATIVTMVILLVVSLYLGLLDVIFFRLMAALLS